MLRWREMLHEENVIRPREVSRVLRATDQKSLPGQTTRGLYKERVEHLLAILGVSAEIGKIGAINIRWHHAPMHFRIHAAIKRSHARRPQLLFQLVQCDPA